MKMTDLSDDQKQILQPTTGYNDEPLLPLEEACESLLNMVPRLQAHVRMAKENFKHPVDGLTQDESAAIHLYTMQWDSGNEEVDESLYAHLNRTLKEVDRLKLRPWFRYFKLLFTALSKIPPISRQIVC
ncbi:unnamed protein product [Rotaria socialis]|uniref:Uncharacterized protein n=2 Tax=Rotaria socialis TaxID=392032 RepID=A0A818CQT6_9BILA|nr:unnamed protein product [Rotaria socialis]CAF3432107.1 unnamed protein product [Rotaria socialis]CAF3783684.1 unnamed protein product [Rotaria socialis]